MYQTLPQCVAAILLGLLLGLPSLKAQSDLPLASDEALRALLGVGSLKSVVKVPAGQTYCSVVLAKITDGKEIRRGDGLGGPVKPDHKYAVDLLWGKVNGEWNSVLRLEPVDRTKSGVSSSGGFYPKVPFFSHLGATNSSVPYLDPSAQKYGPYYLLGGASGRVAPDGKVRQTHRNPMAFPTDKKHTLLLLIAFFPDREAADAARKSGATNLDKALAPLLETSASKSLVKN